MPSDTLPSQAEPQRVPKTPFTDDFKAHLDYLAEHFHVPSMSIGIVDGNEQFIHVQGHASLPDVEVTEDTLHYIASVTKSFTATSLLSLLEERKVSNPEAEPITLQSKIASIIPDDFVLPDAYATAHATLGDALGHLLGVGDHNLNYGGEGYTLRDAIRSMRHLAMTAELREKHQYLNMGYMVIQHVIEALSGQEIAESHHKYIWDPLGMVSTFVKRQDAVAAPNGLATGYSWDPLSNELLEASWAHDYPLVGGGGLISSIRDMTRYLDAVIHKKFPLLQSRHDELFKPRAISEDPPYEHMTTVIYALGWNISSYRGRRLISHSGGISGYSSKVVFLPDEKWGIALLTNSSHGYQANDAAMIRLLDDFLGVTGDQRQDVVPVLDERAKRSLDFYLNTRSFLYPTIPDPPLPSTLPLSAYAGSYHNPGYRTIELTLVQARDGLPVAEGTKEVLHADIRRLLDFTLDLEHISGEFFIGWVGLEKPNKGIRTGFRSQFVLGSDGEARKWGINLKPDASEGDESMMVWFDKV
ncbi:beta-lactamase/transpeptidase-like protein [Thozetella sp. PMI_491]|nr:beta-lactamase/transpeptidase-like protein [Thozetella sp. PMI_491]